MWIAERQAVYPHSDENAAMAYKKSGPFETKEAARRALINMIKAEIVGWDRMGMDSSRDRRALSLITESSIDDHVAIVGGVRWQIRES
jgi:hypothetical protein